MDFNYTEEQQALQDTLQRFIAKDYDFEHRRKLAKSDDGFSPEAWAQYADLGLLALPLPEEHGGLGGNAVDVMVVMREFGRGLLLEPFVSTVVIGAGLIAEAGSAAQQETLLAGVAGGETKLALAHGEPAARYAISHVETTARADGEGWTLTGFKNVVFDAPSADHLIVSARTAGATADADGITLFVVPKDAAGLSLRGYPTQDGHRAADVKLDGVKLGADALLGPVGGGLPLLAKILDKASAALCAESVGLMTALNEQTLEYLKQRKQFGVPIGKFQALQHRMADMIIAAEQAESFAILAAVRADDEDAAERARTIAGARAYIAQQARFVGQQAVQMHGGMGVVDELVVSHLFKRLTMIGLMYGDVDHQMSLFSDALKVA